MLSLLLGSKNGNQDGDREGNVAESHGNLTSSTSPHSPSRPNPLGTPAKTKKLDEYHWSAHFRKPLKGNASDSVDAGGSAKGYAPTPFLKGGAERTAEEGRKKKEEGRNQEALTTGNTPGTGASFAFRLSPPSTLPAPAFQKLNPRQSEHKASKMRPNHPTPSTTTPRSPLPPTLHTPAQNPRTNRRATSDRSANPELRLPSVPGQFHPLLYESHHSSGNASPSVSRPSSSRGPLSPQLQARRPGAAQRQMQHMQQYHREAMERAVSNLMGPPPPTDTPKAPQIEPHGSPGPATPLTLEEPTDYLTARTIGEGSPRTAADKYIREEHERRSGMRVDRSSPAVSPRC